MSISSRSGDRELQRLPCLKWESRFTLGLNAVKNATYIKKLQIKIVQNSISYKKTQRFPTINSVGAYLYQPQKWGYEMPKVRHRDFIRSSMRK